MVVSRGILSKIYDIERFWCPTEGVMGLDRQGYLLDPFTDSLWMGEPDALSFECIEDVSVLVMLGEPGIGKSQWFNYVQDRLRKVIRQRDHQDLWINLGLFDSASDVVDAVFRNIEFIRWAQGEHRLHLFLDSFDECHARVDVLPQRLLNELQKNPVERLCLRIFCRTSEWPAIMDHGLKRLWNDRFGNAPAPAQNSSTREAASETESCHWVQTFEMAPLRRNDVIRIVQGEGIEPVAFLHEIESRELVPFAIKPQTLAFLANTYRTRGRFPSNQLDLYFEGCRELCRNSSRDSTGARLSGKHQTDELLVVAERIAALMIFGKRYSILGHDASLPELGETDLSVRDVCHGTEEVNGREVLVREDIIREALNTGLFSGRSGGKLGWAHQTYADFLAACYLNDRNLPLQQVLNLIVHPRSHHGKIKPQLREVAGWLGAMNPNVYDYIIRRDPEILVDCAAEIRDEGDRERLVKHILLQSGRKESGSQRSLSGRGYRKLCHGALAIQLLPLIKDRETPSIARIRAIAITHHCRVTELLEALVEVALDGSSELRVRDVAAVVVAAADDKAIKAKLKGLALSKVEEDPLDQLKGAALSAVWPDHITAREMFAALSVPRAPNLIGEYSMFLHHNIVPHLCLDDLPTALVWVRDLYRTNAVPRSFSELSDKIMDKAWGYLDAPILLESYAAAACARLNMKEAECYADPEPSFKVFFSSDPEKRRLVTERTLSLIAKADQDTGLPTARLRDMLCRKDLSWLIELLKSSEQDGSEKVLAKLVLHVSNGQDSEHQTLLESIARQCKPLREGLARRQELRESLSQPRTNRTAEPKPEGDDASDKRLSNQIESLLVQCEAGEHGKFFDLASLLIRSCGNTLNPDLTRTRFWRLSAPETRSRILAGARRFLLFEDPANYETPQGKSFVSDVSFVCYRILRLLLPMDRDLFPGGLTLGTWEKWATTTISFPSGQWDQELEMQVLLIENACHFAPGKLAERLVEVIDRENEQLGEAPVVTKLGRCGNKYVLNRLFEKLKEPKLTCKSFELLLRFLVWRSNRDALDFAESLLHPNSMLKPEDRDKCISAAKVLFHLHGTESWSVLWSAIAQDKNFGREVILQGVPLYYSQYELFAQGLTPNQLADLFVWLHRECPPLEPQPAVGDPKDGDGSKLDEIKSYVLSDLRDRGTSEAIGALVQISEEFPSETWIRETLYKAEDRAIEMDWQPIHPQHLLAMVADSRSRVVQSESQLLDVAEESLNEYQKKLKEVELPAIRDIWDRVPGKAQLFRPVDEKDVSDHLARHLQDDLVGRGVVVNREVEIRRGDVTDIHIDAVMKNPGEKTNRGISVIIEVKGCWNKEVFSDMKNQLVDRYMKENQCQHGLYFVGWFHCEKWDPTDSRSKRHAEKKRQMTVKKAQELFDQQAAELSAGASTVKAFVLDASLP